MSPPHCATDYQPQQPREYQYGGNHPEHRILPLVGHIPTDNRRLRRRPAAIGEPPCSCPPPWSLFLHAVFFLLLRFSAYSFRHTTPWAAPSLWGVTLPLCRAETHVESVSRLHFQFRICGISSPYVSMLGLRLQFHEIDDVDHRI